MPAPALPSSSHQPPHHLARPAPVHGQAHQLARGVLHLPQTGSRLLIPFPAGPLRHRLRSLAEIVAKLKHSFCDEQVHR